MMKRVSDDCPGIRLQQTADAADHGGLAGTVGAEESEQFAGTQLQ